MIALILTVFLLFPALAQATTYYVATTGSDSNNGTAVGTPYRSIQKCASVMVQDDICTVANGTYTSTDGGGLQSTGLVTYIRSTYATGSVGHPITIQATNRGGAIITVPGANTTNAGFYISKNYWNIDGFVITGGTGTGSSASHHGIYVGGTTGNRLSHNTIHDIARTVCSGSFFGFTGIFLAHGSTSTTIDHNLLYTIGRLRTGENGCALSPGDGANAQHDHGIYVQSTTGTTISNNVIYDTNRGWPIHVYENGGTTTNLAIYNNTIGGKSSTGSPAGQIIFAETMSTCNVKNNLFYNAQTSAIQTTGSPTFTNCTTTYNKQSTDDVSGDSLWVNALPGSGVTSNNNTDNVSLGFVNAGANDFTLASGSAAIAAGTAVSGVNCNGTCDLGAFETFGFSSAVINGAALDVTMGMNVNTPILPTATGWSAACTGSGCGTPVVSTVALVAGSDSQARITLTGITTGACAVGQTWTVSYTPGTTTDSALIGGTLNQKAFGFTTQAVTNACTSTTPPTFVPIASSTFTGADENPLSESSAWTVTNGGAGSMKRLSNTLSPTTFGSDSTAKYTGAVFNANQYAQAALTTIGTAGAGAGMGLCVRCATAADTKYAFHIDHAASNNAQLSRKIAGVYTNVGTAWTQAFADGDTFTLAVEGETLYVYDKTSTLVKTVVDTGGGVPQSGSAGVSYSSSTSSGTLADTWVGGNYYNTQTPPPPPVGTLTQKDHQFYEARTVAGSAVTLAALSAAATRLPGESFALTTQTDCTVADCDPLSLRLYYSRNSGTFLPVPDTCGADHVCFFGPTGDATVLQGTVTCCLSGALTANDGTTQLTSAAVPIFDLALNASTVHRFIVKFDTGAVATDTYNFETWNQTGVPLTAYSPAGGARITINALASGLAAPATPHQVGPVSGTLVGLVWAPVSYSMLGGYNIYRSTSSGVYGTNWTYQVTLAGAAAAHSPPTQLLTILQTAGTYYFVVKAFSLDGTESAASSEVTIVVTAPPARTLRP